MKAIFEDIKYGHRCSTEPMNEGCLQFSFNVMNHDQTKQHPKQNPTVEEWRGRTKKITFELDGGDEQALESKEPWTSPNQGMNQYWTWRNTNETPSSQYLKKYLDIRQKTLFARQFVVRYLWRQGYLMKCGWYLQMNVFMIVKKSSIFVEQYQIEIKATCLLSGQHDLHRNR